MLRLPEALRGAFKDPLGPVFQDAEALLSAVDRARVRHADPDGSPPLVAVGDVVTYHLRQAGRDPDVAVVDGRTEREAVDEDLRAALDGDRRRIAVRNEPATLSRDLLTALREALDAPDPTVLDVDGEEDLAALPAIVAAPDGASVVYGQPGEGMVHVAVTPGTRAEATTLFSRLDGDVEAALALLERR
jgi:hypothetical protein